MSEEDKRAIINQTYELTSKLTTMYNGYSVRNELLVSKEEFLELHDEIIKKKNVVSLVYFDIALGKNVFYSYDEDYYNILKNDLDILIVLIKEYIKPLTNEVYQTFLKYDSIELSCRESQQNLFDSKLLNNYFDELLGTLLRKNGILDELYYALPKELMDEELTIKLYRLLSAHELAITYYVNNLYEGVDNDFLGNNKTDQIFIELSSRASEDILVFIKDIMKMPCQAYAGIVGGFVHLRKRTTHEYLTSFINHLKLPGESDYLDPDWIFIYYKFLIDAENIIPQIGDITNFDTNKKDLESYIRECNQRRIKR